MWPELLLSSRCVRVFETLLIWPDSLCLFPDGYYPAQDEPYAVVIDGESLIHALQGSIRPIFRQLGWCFFLSNA